MELVDFNGRVEKLKLIGVESGLGGLPKYRSNSLIIVDFSLDELSLVGLRSGRVLICIISLVQIPD